MECELKGHGSCFSLLQCIERVIPSSMFVVIKVSWLKSLWFLGLLITRRPSNMYWCHETLNTVAMGVQFYLCLAFMICFIELLFQLHLCIMSCFCWVFLCISIVQGCFEWTICSLSCSFLSSSHTSLFSIWLSHCSREKAFSEAFVYINIKYIYLYIVFTATFQCIIFFNLCPSHIPLCSLSVTLPPIMSFPLSIHSLQPKPLPRSPALPKWLWPAAVEAAYHACPAVLPVLNVSQWAVPLCGRRRAAGAEPPSPAAAVPPASASWAKANQTPVLLLKMVSTKKRECKCFNILYILLFHSCIFQFASHS